MILVFCCRFVFFFFNIAFQHLWVARLFRGWRSKLESWWFLRTNFQAWFNLREISKALRCKVIVERKLQSVAGLSHQSSHWVQFCKKFYTNAQNWMSLRRLCVCCITHFGSLLQCLFKLATKFQWQQPSLNMVQGHSLTWLVCLLGCCHWNLLIQRFGYKHRIVVLSL